jgi:hypothetical protein
LEDLFAEGIMYTKINQIELYELLIKSALRKDERVRTEVI